MRMFNDWDYDDGDSGSMFGGGKGTWCVSSKIDPRWNASGGPGEMGGWIKRCKKLYGEPPDDCTMSFMKD